MLLSRVGFSNLVWQMDNSIAKSDAAHPPISYRKELGDLLRLGSPLIINNLALAGMGFADAAMAGRLGAIELAAVAVGHSVWMLFFLSALGLLMAISPISARHIGRGSGELIANSLELERASVKQNDGMFGQILDMLDGDDNDSSNGGLMDMAGDLLKGQAGKMILGQLLGR